MNAGISAPCWYFYPECGVALGRTPEKYFGSYRNKKQRSKYLRNYSKADIILLTENWKKVTCEECLRRHPNSKENKEAQRQKNIFVKKRKEINEAISKLEKKRNYYNSKIWKIDNRRKIYNK